MPDVYSKTLCRRERPHNADFRGNNLQLMPYEIDRETCFGCEFLAKVSDVKLSESEKAISFHDAAGHVA